MVAAGWVRRPSTSAAWGQVSPVSIRHHPDSVIAPIEGRLTGNGVWALLRRRAEEAKLTVDVTERLSPHGLRAGFITEVYLHGALDEQAGAHARQKNLNTTRAYRRRVKTIAASPAKLLEADLMALRKVSPRSFDRS